MLPKALWTVVLLSLTTCAYAQSATASPQSTSAPQQVQRIWKPLSQLTYQSADGAHHLVLWKKELPELGELSKSTTDAYFKAHPNAGSTPNTLFSLTDDVGTGTPKLLWVEYVFHDKAILPPQHWYANIVWPAGQASPLVMLTKSISTHLEVSVYRISLKRDIGNLPSDPDLAHFDEWPVPDKPLNTLKLHNIVTRMEDGLDGISALTATAVGDDIVLRGAREDKHSPPVYVSFNMAARRWQKGLQPDALHALGALDKQE